MSAGHFDLICIGSSTGGPPVLETLLTAIAPGLACPVIVAQHMPEVFTRSMAQRLGEICCVPVKLLQSGDALVPGAIHICPGGVHTHLSRAGQAPVRVRCMAEPTSELYRPSVNVLFETAAATTPGRTLGIVLTGIGEDGLKGARPLVEGGSVLLSQSAETCVVYGMPRAVEEAQLSHASLSPPQMAAALGKLSMRQAA